MLAVFLILISGCDHAGEACVTLEEIPVASADLAACEAELDRHLQSQTAMWPTFVGECRSATTTVAGIADPAS